MFCFHSTVRNNYQRTYSAQIILLRLNINSKGRYQHHSRSESTRELIITINSLKMFSTLQRIRKIPVVSPASWELVIMVVTNSTDSDICTKNEQLVTLFPIEYKQL